MAHKIIEDGLASKCDQLELISGRKMVTTAQFWCSDFEKISI